MQERLSTALELTNVIFGWMHAGAMWQLGVTNTETGWREVRRRMERLARLHDAERFAANKPSEK